MSTNDDHVRARRNEDDFDREARRRRYDEDDDDDREGRRPPPRRSEGDATGGLIPYKNGMALASYYCGVFGLISCFLFLGIFGIVPIILGILGLRYAKQHPEAKGQAHAIVGIVLGLVEVLAFVGPAGYLVVAILTKK